MPPLSSHSVGYDEVIEIQHHLVHLNTEHHPKTLVESINSLLHVGNNNGSHYSVPGSGNDLAYATTEEEISEDILIVLFTLVPLIITIAVIFLIAVAIRKMRRSESLQEVQRRNDFKMSTKNKKGLNSSNSNPLPSFTLSKKSKSTKKGDPTLPSSHEIRVVPTPERNRVKFGTQLSFESATSCSSTSSDCSNKSNNVTNSPTGLYFSEVPPWYLYSTPYYRSQYHLNKLHRQLSYNTSGSLQSLGSMQSLNHYDHSSSNGVIPCGSTKSALTRALSDTEPEFTSSSDKKKKASKKLKTILRMMNIAKRIRQHQAEKNRFNIYTIPNETREQLKQIYVY